MWLKLSHSLHDQSPVSVSTILDLFNQKCAAQVNAVRQTGYEAVDEGEGESIFNSILIFFFLNIIFESNLNKMRL
jgi:hypothetical protein